MCLHPILIKNPNRGVKKDGINLFKDCTSAYIPINCGHCPQCIALKQMYLVQRIMMEQLNHYLYFGTLTYNDESLPYIEVNGRNIYYADIIDFQKMFKRIRNHNLFSRDFSYMIVSEFGTLKHRPHFHFLLSLPRYSDDNEFTPLQLERLLFDAVLQCWSRNIGSDKKPIYKPNCTFTRKFVNGQMSYNYDLHYVNPYLTDEGASSAAYYCLKYMLKPSDYVINLQRALKLNLDEKSYNSIWKMVRPRFAYSKGLGLVAPGNNSRRFDSDSIDPDIANHIRKCISFSKAASDYPLFLVPGSAQVMPLSPFYRHHFMRWEDYHYFYRKRQPDGYEDTFYEMDNISDSEFRQYMLEFEKRVKMAHSADFSDF